MKYKINFTAKYKNQVLNFKNVTVCKSSQGTTWAPMAGVSSVIRQFTKQVFPELNFRISSSTFAGGDSVTIYIQEPVSNEEFAEIRSVLKNFQSGTFNGMIDLYEYNDNSGINVVVDGVRYEFDTKYISVENRPKYGTPEHTLWYEKLSKKSH